MTIEIAWEAGEPPPDLDEAELRRALQAFLAAIGREGWGVSLLLAGDATLQTLNREYRTLDRPTDVLSWPYQPEVNPGDEADDPPLLGELALSLDRAGVQAGENGWPRPVEVLRLLAHGCAHLAGYDHETPEEEREMLAVEERMLANAGIDGLYPPAGE